MRHLDLPEQQPNLLVQDSAEAFMADHVARHHTDDADLREQTERLVDAVLDHDVSPGLELFAGQHAMRLLAGLQRVIDTTPEADWRQAQARYMLTEYQRSVEQTIIGESATG